MQWHDSGLILSMRKHGESAHLVQLFTRSQGKHAGMTRISRKQAAGLQPGNIVQAEWKARLEEHLGTYRLEVEEVIASHLLDDRRKLTALSSVCTLLETAFPERDPHVHIYDEAVRVLRILKQDGAWEAEYVRFELSLLAELGFGLDLTECALTGSRDDLAWVSPKSGRAACEEAGAPYQGKLLVLPRFLVKEVEPDHTQIVDGLALTGYFLGRAYAELMHKDMPAARGRLVEQMGKVLA